MRSHASRLNTSCTLHTTGGQRLGALHQCGGTAWAAARTAQREQAKQATAPAQQLTGRVLVSHCHNDICLQAGKQHEYMSGCGVSAAVPAGSASQEAPLSETRPRVQ